MNVSMQNKICRDCGVEKNVYLEFSKRSKIPVRCKQCDREKQNMDRSKRGCDSKMEWLRRPFFSLALNRKDPRDSCIDSCQDRAI